MSAELPSRPLTPATPRSEGSYARRPCMSARDGHWNEAFRPESPAPLTPSTRLPSGRSSAVMTPRMPVEEYGMSSDVFPSPAAPRSCDAPSARPRRRRCKAEPVAVVETPSRSSVEIVPPASPVRTSAGVAECGAPLTCTAPDAVCRATSFGRRTRSHASTSRPSSVTDDRLPCSRAETSADPFSEVPLAEERKPRSPVRPQPSALEVPSTPALLDLLGLPEFTPSAKHDFWDEAEEQEEKCDKAFAALPASVSVHGGTFSCTRSHGAVTMLSLNLGQTGGAVSAMDTMSSPHAVRGLRISWVRGEVLGRGSLGSVMKAVNQRTGQTFAVKEVLIDDKNQSDRAFQSALETEVEICQDLKHPNIVSYLGHDYLEGRLHIYLEYMPGGSMAQVLSQFGPLDESLLVVYTKMLLEGLEYLHTREPAVLHRDIKGANILVGVDCRVKLSDFGCSKRTTETLAHSMKGSIPWMAPEVIKNTGYGRAADIWSFGCLVIEMGTAKTPWGKFDNPMAAMMRIGMSQDLPALPDNLSVPCQDFILKCLQRDKNARPTATALLSHELVRDCPSDR